MSGNGKQDEQVLSWPKRLLSADDLRQLNGQRELRLLPRTIVTPLAADELRARGVRVTWLANPQATVTSVRLWGYGQEKNDALVTAAVQALEREGLSLVVLPSSIRDVVARLMMPDCSGAVYFCGDPALACCIANKHSGVRAAPVLTMNHAAKARASLGANLFAVEMPGRTFFELRQILRTIAGAPSLCPVDVATTLKELDGHAHR
jgi:hypothetical protein